MKTNTKKQDFNKTGNTTVSVVRSAMFAPTLKRNRNKGQDIIFQNSWASLKVPSKYNHLTQTHLNILDLIFANATESIKLLNGELVLKFNVWKILKALGQTGYNYEWLKDKLDDLQTTLTILKTKDYELHETIIHFHKWTKTPNDNIQKKGFTKDKNEFGNLYGVCFNSSFVKFFNIDVNLNYVKILPDILALPSGVLQAFVRFCISHDKLNMKLTDILINIRAIDNIISERTKERIIKGINDNSNILFEKFKIQIKDGIVYYDHSNADSIYFLTHQQ
jgi:hypothetical protein